MLNHIDARQVLQRIYVKPHVYLYVVVRSHYLVKSLLTDTLSINRQSPPNANRITRTDFL